MTDPPRPLGQLVCSQCGREANYLQGEPPRCQSCVHGGLVDPSVSRSGVPQPKPRPWYRPAVMWEWQRPWWGFHRLDEQDVIPGLPPVRALFIGPITLIWMGPIADA